MRKLIAIGALLLSGSAVLFLLFWHRYIRDAPAERYGDALLHFKYGSYGAEKTGMPYPIWKVLPQICPDLLPLGWAQLGFHTEPGHDLPVGVSLRKFGVPRVGLNCAACHSGTIGGGPEKGGTYVPGMPSPRFDSQGYNRFVLRCTTSDRFSPDIVMTEIERAGISMPFYDRLVYRYLVVGRAKQEAAAMQQAYAWMNLRPDQGPGRTDTVNAFRMLLHLRPESDSRAAPVDYPSLWNQGPRARAGGGQHWDGDNDSFRERTYTSALASGCTEDSIDIAAIERVSDWIVDLPAPRYPFPIDSAKAEQGRKIWHAEKCAECHEFGGEKAGQITPRGDIGVDPGRNVLFTPEVAERFKTLGVGRPWHITHYRSTAGYLNVWLDGIWARAPYLHNGSVPTLWDLLQPPDKRPAELGRGCDTFDQKKVGWSCERPFRFRTSLQGNSNAGHLYGTQLSDEEKLALIEHMKTL